MMNTEVKTVEDLGKLSPSKRSKFSDGLGAKVGKMFNGTVKKANKLLNPFGFEVSIDLHFKVLSKE